MKKLRKLYLIWHCKQLIVSGNGVLAFGYKKRMLKLQNRTHYLSDKEALGFRYLRRKGKLKYGKYSYSIASPHSGIHRFNDDYYTLNQPHAGLGERV